MNERQMIQRINAFLEASLLSSGFLPSESGLTKSSGDLLFQLTVLAVKPTLQTLNCLCLRLWCDVYSQKFDIAVRGGIGKWSGSAFSFDLSRLVEPKGKVFLVTDEDVHEVVEEMLSVVRNDRAVKLFEEFRNSDLLNRIGSDPWMVQASREKIAQWREVFAAALQEDLRC